MISSRARPYLLREWATLAAFSRISGVGRSGSWPPLHCRDSTGLAPEAVPGASLRSGALLPECGGTGGPEMVWLARHVGAGLRGLLGPTAHGLLGRRHPGPRLGRMVGWGLGYQDSRIFVGAWHVLSYLWVWSLGLFSPTFFSTS